jgi:hypothetical protein
MNALLMAEGIRWHALLAVVVALLIFFGGGWLLQRVAQWFETGWNTWELAGTPLCRVTLMDWVTLTMAVVLCTLAFLITFVPLMPFCWVVERWLARTYYFELAPVRK